MFPDRQDFPIDVRHRRLRLAQSQAFDKTEHFRVQLVRSAISPDRAGKACETTRTIARQPSLCRSQRDTGIQD